MSKEVKKILKDYYNLKFRRFEDVEIALSKLNKGELVDFILEAQSRFREDLSKIFELLDEMTDTGLKQAQDELNDYFRSKGVY